MFNVLVLRVHLFRALFTVPVVNKFRKSVYISRETLESGTHKYWVKTWIRNTSVSVSLTLKKMTSLPFSKGRRRTGIPSFSTHFLSPGLINSPAQHTRERWGRTICPEENCKIITHSGIKTGASLLAWGAVRVHIPEFKNTNLGVRWWAEFCCPAFGRVSGNHTVTLRAEFPWSWSDPWPVCVKRKNFITMSAQSSVGEAVRS